MENETFKHLSKLRPSWTSLKSQYVSFRSLFAVSDKRLQESSKSVYLSLLEFVRKDHEMKNCDATCASACPNCEVLERMWGSILNCADRFTRFHRIHSQGDQMWNIVRPRTCYDENKSAMHPSLAVEVCATSGTISFGGDPTAVTFGIYVAALLRWQVTLVQNCRLSQEQTYDFHHFQSHVSGELGLTTVFQTMHEFENTLSQRCTFDHLQCDSLILCIEEISRCPGEQNPIVSLELFTGLQNFSTSNNEGFELAAAALTRSVTVGGNP